MYISRFAQEDMINKKYLHKENELNHITLNYQGVDYNIDNSYIDLAYSKEDKRVGITISISDSTKPVQFFMTYDSFVTEPPTLKTDINYLKNN